MSLDNACGVCPRQMCAQAVATKKAKYKRIQSAQGIKTERCSYVEHMMTRPPCSDATWSARSAASWSSKQ